LLTGSASDFGIFTSVHHAKTPHDLRACRQYACVRARLFSERGISFQKENCFDIALTAVYVSQQFWQDTDVGSPAIPKAKIPSYKTFNLSGDWYITKNLRLIAGISNLTDEKYYDRVFGNGIEPAPRRSGYAGVPLAF
jgi:Fe(3+) dicitrate transport protein